VAIYNDDGGRFKRNYKYRASLADTSIYNTARVMAADIRAGILQNFDIIVATGREWFRTGDGFGNKREETR
jgi:hypothetical protein